MENIAPALLEWFYKNQRILPFRTDPSPYHVWLSEIMLQQTRVSAALPYYERFLAALPDIPALAACEEEKLHKLWVALDQACADACLNAQPLPNSQLGQNLAKPGWNCHHDNFKDSNPNIEWKATLEQAEKIGMGTRQYVLKKV